MIIDYQKSLWNNLLDLTQSLTMEKKSKENSPVLGVDLLRSNPSCLGLVFASCLGCWLCATNGVWGVLRGVCDWWGCTGGSWVVFCGWDCWDWWDWGLLGNEDTLLGLEGGEALCVNAKAWLCKWKYSIS